MVGGTTITSITISDLVNRLNANPAEIEIIQSLATNATNGTWLLIRDLIQNRQLILQITDMK